MATFARSTERAASRSLTYRLRSLNLRLQAYRAEASRRSRIMRELSTYSNDELSELGLNRADIPAVAAGTYRR